MLNRDRVKHINVHTICQISTSKDEQTSEVATAFSWANEVDGKVWKSVFVCKLRRVSHESVEIAANGDLIADVKYQLPVDLDEQQENTGSSSIAMILIASEVFSQLILSLR